MNLETLARLQKKHESGAFLPTLKIPTGETAGKGGPALRIVPGNYGEDGTLPFLPVVRHWLNPLHKKPVLCLDNHGPNGGPPDAPCGVCAQRKAMFELERKVTEQEKKGGLTDADKEKLKKTRALITALLKAFRDETRFYMLVVYRPDSVLYEYPSPKSVFDAMCNIMMSNSESDFIDPYNGHDFRVKREDKNNRTTYSVSAVLAASALADSNDRIEDILEKAKGLPLLRRVTDDEAYMAPEQLNALVAAFVAHTKKMVDSGKTIDGEVSSISDEAASVLADDDEPTGPPPRQAPVTDAPNRLPGRGAKFASGVIGEDDTVPMMAYTADEAPALVADDAPAASAPEALSQDTASLLAELGDLGTD